MEIGYFLKYSFLKYVLYLKCIFIIFIFISNFNEEIYVGINLLFEIYRYLLNIEKFDIKNIDCL